MLLAKHWYKARAVEYGEFTGSSSVGLESGIEG